jgi:tripartite motif-containing protein 71
MRRCAWLSSARTELPSGALAAAFAVALVLGFSWPAAWASTVARAETDSCPGSGGAPCPYASAQLIGQRAEGVLRFPEAVAVDTQGNVYIADQLSYVVQEFTASGTFETQWGSYGGGQGQFGPIGGLATDAAGNVYVIDSSHDRVEKFSPSGVFITAWGRKGTGLGEFEFGSSENYTQPPGGGIAVSGAHVYVADSGNNRIERFNLEGGEPIAWGSYGSGPGQFSYPRGVAANESEVVVSDDDNHRVEKFNTEGAFEAQAGTEGDGPSQFAFPYGIALDAAGDVFVADDSNDRIVKLTPQLQFAGVWGTFGSKPGQLAFPRAVASDPAGDTYVADTANDRIEVFNPDGDYLRTLGISAYGPGLLTAPRGLAIDPTGQLLVADTDGNRIEQYAPGSDAYTGQWTLAGGHAAGFYYPQGIGIDPRGSVYVADVGNERLVRLWGDGTYLGEIGGPAELGGAQLSGAGSVAVSSESDLTYVADTNHNRVLVYGPEGRLQARWGAGEGDGSAGNGPGALDHPSAFAIAPDGDVYVADTGNDRVVELSSTGSVLEIWGAKGTADGRFKGPVGVAVDGAGNVYVLDNENDRVQEFDSSGRFLTKWGVRGDGVGEFSEPAAIAVDCAGDVYVADTNNNRIQRFNMAAPAGSGCLAQGSWPPPLNVAPVVHVSVPRVAGVLARHGLAVAVSCERGCKVLATATLAPIGRRPRAVALLSAARGLPAKVTERVRLLVDPTALRRLRKELGTGRAMRARVKIVAAGPTGLRTTVTRSFLVSR